MTVETVTYISDLNAAYPASTDDFSEGDDHIRNLKTGLRNSFPGIGGVVSATHTELNYLDITTPGVSQASKALVTDAGHNLTFIGDLAIAAGGTATLDSRNIITEANEYLVFKDANESVTTATLQTDNELTAPIVSGVKYGFQLYMVYSSNATANFKLDFAANGSGYYSFFNQTDAKALSTDTLLTTGDTSTFAVLFTGTLTASSNGAITLRWAQQTASGTATVYAGSWMKLMKQTG